MSIDPLKLLIVLVVALVLLGPEKLPEAARRLGAAWAALHRLRENVDAEVRKAVPDLPPTHEIVRAARSPLSYLDRLADDHRQHARAALRETLIVGAEPASGTSVAPPPAPPHCSGSARADDPADRAGGGRPSAAFPVDDPGMN